MDSVQELEERSNSFQFDEQDEERILAEMNQRYQNQQANTQAASGSGGGGFSSTDQFMRQMGVAMTSDTLAKIAKKSDQINQQKYGAKPQQNMNSDLESIGTDQLRYGQQQRLVTPDKSSVPSRPGLQDTAEVLRHYGVGIDDVGAHLRPPDNLDGQ